MLRFLKSRKTLPSENAAGRKSGLACDLSTESLHGQPSGDELCEYTSQTQTNATSLVSPPTSASPTSPFSRSTPTSSTIPACTTADDDPATSQPARPQLKMERDRGRISRRPKQLWSRTNHHHSTIDEDDDAPPAAGADQRTQAVQVALPFVGDTHALSKGRFTSQSWSPGLRRQRGDCDPSEARDRRLSMGDSRSTTDTRLLVARGLPNGAVILSPNGDIYRQYIAPHFRRSGALVVSSSATPEFTSRNRDVVERKTSLPARSCQEKTDRDREAVHDVLSRRRTVDVPRRAGTRTGDTPGNRRPGSGGRDLSKTLKYLSKEELLHMWKLSEKALNRQLKEALKHTEDLQQRLRSSDRLTIT